MKKSTIKILVLSVLLIMVIAITLPVLADTENKSIILKTEENEFIVYYEEAYENEFQFAISENSNETNLTYVSSVKDSLEDGALNVAFIDSTNNPSNSDVLYLWIMDNDDNEIVSSYEINLSEALTDEIIELVNTTTIVDKDTDRIKVDTTQTQTTKSNVDGVDTTITIGKIVVEEKDKASYSYELISANDSNSNPGKLYNLVDKINSYSGDTYGRLKLIKEFYDLYTELMPGDSEWTNVENSQILQPEDSKIGDRYIVYIKEVSSDGTITVDVKLLECTRIEDKGVNEVPGKVPVITPVTYDSVTLFVILAVVILAIIIVAILKVKSNKKSDK